jgi:hypothetical protein
VVREHVGTAAVFALVYGVISLFVADGDLLWLLPVLPFAFTTHLAAAVLGAIYARPRRQRR